VTVVLVGLTALAVGLVVGGLLATYRLRRWFGPAAHLPPQGPPVVVRRSPGDLPMHQRLQAEREAARRGRPRQRSGHVGGRSRLVTRRLDED